MSNRLLSLAWVAIGRKDDPAGKLSPTEKVVLAALADAANEEARTWLAIRSLQDNRDLMTMTSLSERAIQNSIKALVDGGHITRDQRARGVIYTVHPRTTCTPQADPEPSEAQEMHPAGDAPQDVHPAPRAPDPAPPAPKSTITPKLTLGIARAGERGRRIDHDWQPTKPLPEKVAKAVAGWPPGRLDDVLDEFRDFWRADAGKRATKIDWDLTWHNRLRAEIKHDGRRGRPHGQRPDTSRRFRDPLLERDFRAGRLDPAVG